VARHDGSIWTLRLSHDHEFACAPEPPLSVGGSAISLINPRLADLGILTSQVLYQLAMPGGSDTVIAYEFEQFVLEIVRHSPEIDSATAEPLGTDYGVDIVAKLDNQPLLITVQLAPPQTSFRLEQVTSKMQAAADLFLQQHPDAKPQPVLVFPGVLAESKKTRRRNPG
jgi:hypothetical protein